MNLYYISRNKCYSGCWSRYITFACLGCPAPGNGCPEPLPPYLIPGKASGKALNRSLVQFLTPEKKSNGII